MNKETNTGLIICTGYKVRADDIGCWADGGYGHGHIREVLSVLLCDKEGPLDLAVALINEPSDDFSEEDDAIDWLNENACEEGVHFELAEGDLLLLANKDDA